MTNGALRAFAKANKRRAIQALLGSDIPGEAQAAAAALERLGEAVRPAVGTPEWNEAMQAWRTVVNFCASRISSPELTPGEVRLVRNWQRYGGTPWERDASELRRIQRKLERN